MATATSAPPAAPAPGLLDALSLLTEVADELVVGTVRDTHFAWSARVHGLLRGTRGAPAVRHGITASVYAGLGAGLRAASRGLDAVAASGVGPRLESRPSGRYLNAAVNGLIGDRLERERPRLAIPMAVRAHRRDVPLDREALAAAYPGARPRPPSRCLWPPPPPQPRWLRSLRSRPS